MQIYGYSERGMINSIIYSMNENQILRLIKKIAGYKNEESHYESVIILIEQSLSDFGDADLIVVYNVDGMKHVVFVEAKVKTYGTKTWSIENEYNKFNNIEKNNGSNIFRQLSLKKALIENISHVKDRVEISQEKIYRNKKNRRIGGNGIVLKALDLIKDASNYHFIGLVPAKREEIENLIIKSEEKFIRLIPWSEIEAFAEEEKLLNVIENFKYNYGQIY